MRAQSTWRSLLGVVPARVVPRRVEHVVVLLALLVGAALRISFLAWGLPGGLHQDERVITEPAIDMAERNSFEPNVFMRPDHLEIKLSFILYQLYSHLVLGTPAEVAFAASVDPFLVMSRLVTTGFGLALVILGYLVARRFGSIAGMAAAILFAIHPFYVEHSLYATPDVPLAACAMFVTWALLRYVSQPTWVNLFLASLGVSLGIAAKYPGALSAVMIAIVVTAVAVRDRAPMRWLRHAAVSLACVLGLLFLIAPNLFTNFSAVREALANESGDTHLGADGLNFIQKMLFYLGAYVEIGGIVLCVLTLTGVLIVATRPQWLHLPLAMGIVYLLGLSLLGLHWERWASPIFTTLLILAALATQWFADRVPVVERVRFRSIAAAVLVGALVMSALALTLQSLAKAAQLSAPNTRHTSIDVAARVGANAGNSVYEGYTPMQPKSRGFIFDQFAETAEGWRPIDPSKRFVVLSGDNHDRFFLEDKYVVEQAFYTRLWREYPVAAEVSPTLGERHRQPFEPVTIVATVSEIIQILNGATVGPKIDILKVPD